MNVLGSSLGERVQYGMKLSGHDVVGGQVAGGKVGGKELFQFRTDIHVLLPC